mmetsp:Transcript_31464/g.92027  ORF Transcript_31464/g.92027 Transcript_31464/m.92027 type:complete len:245 (+) Transcript_31464:289-1023(+)
MRRRRRRTCSVSSRRRILPRAERSVRRSAAARSPARRHRPPRVSPARLPCRPFATSSVRRTSVNFVPESPSAASFLRGWTWPLRSIRRAGTSCATTTSSAHGRCPSSTTSQTRRKSGRRRTEVVWSSTLQTATATPARPPIGRRRRCCPCPTRWCSLLWSQASPSTPSVKSAASAPAFPSRAGCTRRAWRRRSRPICGTSPLCSRFLVPMRRPPLARCPTPRPPRARRRPSTRTRTARDSARRT